MEDARNAPAKAKRQPPQNPIIGKARADKWDRQIDGLITDLDINTSQGARILNRVRGMSTWMVWRDIIMILLLLIIAGLLIWRAMVTDGRFNACEGSVVTMDIPANAD